MAGVRELLTVLACSCCSSLLLLLQLLSHLLLCAHDGGKLGTVFNCAAQRGPPSLVGRRHWRQRCAVVPRHHALSSVPAHGLIWRVRLPSRRASIATANTHASCCFCALLTLARSPSLPPAPYPCSNFPLFRNQDLTQKKPKEQREKEKHEKAAAAAAAGGAGAAALEGDDDDEDEHDDAEAAAGEERAAAVSAPGAAAEDGEDEEDDDEDGE